MASRRKPKQAPKKRRTRKKRDPEQPKGEFPSRKDQFPPGTTGNPKGRPTAGATMIEWANVLTDPARPALEPELRRIEADPNQPPTKRAAALWVLSLIDRPNLTDYEPLLKGAVGLDELRKSGVDTRHIKKLKQKSRREVVGTNPDDSPIEEDVIEREIELHDRIGEAFDRIADRTHGRPRQQVDLTSVDDSLKTPADGAAAATDLLARLASRLGADRLGTAADPAAR